MHPFNRAGRQITKPMAEKLHTVDVIRPPFRTWKDSQCIRLANSLCTSKQRQRIILASRNVYPLEKIRILRSLLREQPVCEQWEQVTRFIYCEPIFHSCKWKKTRGLQCPLCIHKAVDFPIET